MVLNSARIEVVWFLYQCVVALFCFIYSLRLPSIYLLNIPRGSINKHVLSIAIVNLRKKMKFPCLYGSMPLAPQCSNLEVRYS